MAQQTRFGAGSASGVIALAAMAALILPRSVQRSASYSDPMILGIAGLAGIAVLILVDIAISSIGATTPNLNSHTIASRYVAGAAGVVAAAARFVGYVLLLVLAAGLISMAVNALTPNEFDGRIVIITSVVVLALPIMLRWRVNWRGTIIASLLAMATLTAILINALIKEASRMVSLSTLITNRVEPTGFVSVNHPLLQTFVVMCFPAALTWFLAERVSPTARTRRVPSKFMRITISLALVYTALTFYVGAQLGVATWPIGMPSLVIAAAFWGNTGRIISAVAFLILGIACTLAVYDRLPRLLRTLAIDGMLPHRLASTEAGVPRRLVVGLAALLGALLGNFLTTTYAGVVAFVFTSFIGFVLTSFGIFIRGRRLLRDSERRDERRRARKNVWLHAFLSLGALALLILIGVLQPLWAALSLLSLLVPTVMILGVRRGRGKMTEKLAPQDLREGRALPVRIHAVVIVTTLDLPTLRAVTYARGLRAATLTALTVDFEPKATDRLREDWQESNLPVSLTVLGTPEGATREPITEYVRSLLKRYDRDVVMVIVPRVLSESAWQRVFLTRSAPRIFSDLAGDSRVMFAQVPYLIEDARDEHLDEHERRVAGGQDHSAGENVTPTAKVAAPSNRDEGKA